ncbi:MAG TPA: lysylphosphatidylglycerol synthase transmembrane domain-containing protein [Gemmatimonadales bacterium]|nr:lysylphosphatidylglycerol synthase transmembrane domain-containing protein [Gemmatimonadales bacterium]
MTPVEAHLICIGLVAADLIARAWRIQWIVQGLGHRMTTKDTFILNAFGDAACALTPLRIGGEPARLAGMLRSGVPAPAAFVGISLEVLAAWPVIILAVGWLGWQYAPAWWTSVGPRLSTAAQEAWPWVALVALASIVAWYYARRVASPVSRHLQRPVRRALLYWRRMPRWPLVASIPLSLINLVTRVAILPVLALTLAHPPALGPMMLGSFALLYSQLVLPTPSGAGAVEFGFLAGAAGDLGNDQAWLLLAWRFYTSGVGVILGVWLAVQIYGWPALRKLVRPGAAEVRESSGS